MSTLEDRLRTALASRAEAVTLPMLTRSLPTLEADPEPADPVILLAPGRPHRSRRLVAVALAVAAVLLVAFGAVALHRASTPGTVGPAHIGKLADIPWDRVGPGWTLRVAEPGTVDVPGGVAGWLYLVDPDGQPYRICQLPDGYGFDLMPSWGKPFNTDRVVLERVVDSGQTSLLEIDLHSGAQQSVLVPGSWHLAMFVSATSILLNNVDTMITVNAATGRTEARFAGSEFFGALASPDRRLVVSGTSTDVAVLDIATGAVIRRLAVPSGYQACVPHSWLPNATSFTARCQHGPQSVKTLTFTFPVDGTAKPKPPALPAGWDEVHLAAADIAVASVGRTGYELNGMTFARVSPSGGLEPISVPKELSGAGWEMVFVTPLGFVVEHIVAGGADAVASWNPLTGEVDHTLPHVRSGSPIGFWAPWDGTLF